jgi:hypothetical protein
MIDVAKVLAMTAGFLLVIAGFSLMLVHVNCSTVERFTDDEVCVGPWRDPRSVDGANWR